MSQAFLDKELTPKERYVMKTQASNNWITSCCYDPADLMVRIHEENNIFLEVFMVVQLSTLSSRKWCCILRRLHVFGNRISELPGVVCNFVKKLSPNFFVVSRGGLLWSWKSHSFRASHFQDSGRGPNIVLEMPWSIASHIWKKLDSRFVTFDNNPKNWYGINNKEVWSWKKLF